MALRTLMYFHINKESGRCLLNNVKDYKKLLEVPNSSQYARGFKRLKEDSNRTAVSNVLRSKRALSIYKLWKPFGFTIIFGSAAHIGATIWEYERIRSHTYQLINRYQQWRMSKNGWRGEIEKWWSNLSDGQRVFAPICFLNLVICLGWRIPALKNTMVHYFCSNPASRAICWPMVLSTFSHISILHLAVNMYVLHSFSSTAVEHLGREQFVALYLTSGVMSSFVSYFFKTLTNRPGLTLGASGAIMGVVSFICLQCPETQLNIVFLPMFTFTAKNAIKSLLLIDTLGCAFRWSFFDHAAHLGGAFWGIFWQLWGNSNIWQKREPVLNFWHRIREPPKY